MKVFESKQKNLLYFLYRMILPFFDPVRLYSGIIGYPWYIRDVIKYQQLSPNTNLLTSNMFPILNEKNDHPFDAHYFYQELWAFRKILDKKPKRHVDIASKIQFSGFVAAITPCDYVDIRSVSPRLKNLSMISASVLSLPYKDNSLPSISTLHVIEHIGLGRYGDPIDPDGTKKACKELIRVLKPGGDLYVSLPLGKYRICFNAHRVHPPTMILEYFKPLKLVNFSLVDDSGKFIENASHKEYLNLHYGCGMYHFTKNV